MRDSIFVFKACMESTSHSQQPAKAFDQLVTATIPANIRRFEESLTLKLSKNIVASPEERAKCSFSFDFIFYVGIM